MKALLVLALLLAPPEGESGESGESASGAADPAAGEAQRLYDRGQALYRTSDYDGAIDAFTEAFISADQITDEQLRYNVNAALTFNLARAHMKGYGNDRKAEHVRKTVDLLEKYLQLELDPADVAEAQTLLDEAKAKLEEIEAAEAAAAERAAAAAADSTPSDEGSAESTPPPPDTSRPPDQASPAKGLQIGGITALAIGGAGLGVAGAGLAIGNSAQQDYEAGPLREDRDAAEKRGNTANALTYVGAGLGAVGIIAGAVMLGIAAKKKKASNVAFAPVVTPRVAGASLVGRF